MHLTPKVNTLQRRLLVLFTLMATMAGFSQNIGIGTASPHPSAVLDVSHPSRGLLLPRMDSVQRKNIAAAKGLLVFDTTTNCHWFHNGAIWVNIPAAGATAGDLLFWNGSRWAALPRGVPGQYLIISAATQLPVWSGAGTVAITTTPASSITQTSAVSGGAINSDGGALITARGVVWSTAPNPTTALPTKTNDGSGTGSFTSNLTGLIAGYTYYVRAYATNANGTTYGNQVSFVTTGTGSYTLGQLYGGGVIFYIDGTGQHGLIAALQDQSISIGWYTGQGTAPVTGATAVGIGTGSANTTTIVNLQGTGSYAASLCRLYYNGGGFTDWHLPSLYELNQLFLQRNVITGVGTPLTSYYWSSSEIGPNDAWVIDFDMSGPNQLLANKYNTVKVRAVRAF